LSRIAIVEIADGAAAKGDAQFVLAMTLFVFHSLESNVAGFLKTQGM
jgi:hypothetical protein